MKVKRKKLGLIFIICGIAIIGAMFIPVISVYQGAYGFLRLSGPVATVVDMTWKTYSPFDFVYMMFSNKYSLGNYILVSILCFAIFCIAVFLIVRGIVLIATRKSAMKEANK